MRRARIATLLVGVALTAAACGSSDNGATTATAETGDETTTTAAETTTTDADTTTTTSTDGVATQSTFTAEVWADNWFALYVNGELVGEDSVPITTERSFNSETITFEATYPLTIAIEAKDYMETDSGLEYIGESNQQMGDGGLIAQITDNATGETVAVTSGDWDVLVTQRAPLNTECEDDSDPDATCQFEISETPDGWADIDFDSSAWDNATVWSEADVAPKQGFDDISWDPSAQLIWGSDLEVDNTLLLRFVVAG